MATISVNLPSDGSTADVSDINDPINTIVSEINGNLDNDNIKAGAAIDPSKLASTGFLGSWTSYTPTLTGSTTNPTLGTAGTITGKYSQTGKTVRFEVNVTFGSSGVSAGSGTYIISLPVTAKSGYDSNFPVGHYFSRDSSTAKKVGGLVVMNSTSNVNVALFISLDNHSSLTSASPWAWAAGDTFFLSGTYEAA